MVRRMLRRLHRLRRRDLFVFAGCTCLVFIAYNHLSMSLSIGATAGQSSARDRVGRGMGAAVQRMRFRGSTGSGVIARQAPGAAGVFENASATFGAGAQSKAGEEEIAQVRSLVQGRCLLIGKLCLLSLSSDPCVHPQNMTTLSQALQSYCHLPHVPLEDEWVRYLEALPQPSAIPPCNASPHLAKIVRRRRARERGGDGAGVDGDGGQSRDGEDAPGRDDDVEVFVLPVSGACGKERLLMTWLDEASAALVYTDITQAPEALLPSESAILHCDPPTPAHTPLAQLILEPQLRRDARDTAARAEERYRKWRQGPLHHWSLLASLVSFGITGLFWRLCASLGLFDVKAYTTGLPEGARKRVAPSRPNVLFIMVDSLSRGLAEEALPETLSLLRRMQDNEGVQGGEARGRKRDADGGRVSGVGAQVRAQQKNVSTHTAFEFLRFNVVSSGTHNNVPAYLAGRKYAELPGTWPDTAADDTEWILETARRNGYVTAFLDGEFVGSKSSLPRVRLKSFELYDTPANVVAWAMREALRMADHVIHPIFDRVLTLMQAQGQARPGAGGGGKGAGPGAKAAGWSSFGVSSPRLCFGGQVSCHDPCLVCHTKTQSCVCVSLSPFPAPPSSLFLADV